MVDPDSPHAWTHSGVVLGVALVARGSTIWSSGRAAPEGVAPRTRVPVSID